MRHCVRFGHHKCLTKFFNEIFDKNRHFLGGFGPMRDFLRGQTESRFVSLNDTIVNPDRHFLRHASIFHVIRHPKDLITSGYFYHRRAAELWTHREIGFPLAARYRLELAGVLRDEEIALIGPDVSMHEMLASFDFETGMMIEMIWRKFPCGFNPVPYYENPRVRSVRFEDVMANPYEELVGICDHFRLGDEETDRILSRTRSVFQNKSDHIRDHSSDQYRRYFTPTLHQFFETQFPRIIESLDYQTLPSLPAGAVGPDE